MSQTRVHDIYLKFSAKILIHVSQGCFRNTQKLWESRVYSNPKVTMQPSLKVLLHNYLLWVGTLQSVLVSGSCFDLLRLTGAYSAPDVVANLIKVWAMGLTTGCKVNNNVTSIKFLSTGWAQLIRTRLIRNSTNLKGN